MAKGLKLKKIRPLPFINGAFVVSKTVFCDHFKVTAALHREAERIAQHPDPIPDLGGREFYNLPNKQRVMTRLGDKVVELIEQKLALFPVVVHSTSA